MIRAELRATEVGAFAQHRFGRRGLVQPEQQHAQQQRRAGSMWMIRRQRMGKCIERTRIVQPVGGGVLLALGRRSSLPVVKLFSTAFIELVRGVPLVTILFMSSIILALFLPQGFRIDRLIRALLGMTLFSAAYMAENVRGGLQAIPKGQIEAAKAVGLSSFQTTLLIVLPQALRAVIPSIVGQLISLFKDTTLAIIIAINELLSIGKSIIQSDVEFLQLQLEVFIFIAAVFWIFSSVMSFSSRRLEERLGVGER